MFCDRKEGNATKCIVRRLLAGIFVLSFALTLGCGNQDEPITLEPSDSYGIDPSDGGLKTDGIADGLVAYWPFNGNADDESGSSNHGTVYGAALTTDRCGNPNSAFSFDGVDDYIRVAHDPSLNFGTGDFTINLWIDLVPTPGRGTYFVQKGTTGGGATSWEVLHEIDGVGHFYFQNGWDHFCYAAGTTILWDSEEHWHCITAIKRGNQLEFYTNGVLEDSTTCLDVTTADTGVDLFIGARSDLRWYTYVQGKLDDIRIYNRALTDEEIRALCRECAEAEVVIDIKPGSDPNSINPRSRGVIPVAILTTSVADGDQLDFDAATVDPLSVEFGPDGATEASGMGHTEDVDADGDMDLVLYFRTQETGIECGSSEASLTGETYDGQAIVGSDAIQTVGCEGKPGPPVAPH